MKKKVTKYLAFALCCLMLFPFFAACNGKGNITYAGRALEAGVVGVEYWADVATAEGTDQLVRYALAEESNLPDGVKLSSAGEISGVPGEKGAFEFTVVAKAENADPCEAEFTLVIGDGTLIYEGDSLRAAVDRVSALTVATAKNAGGDIAYVKKSGDLPAGLTLGRDGKITGTPTELGEKTTFTVTASSKDCASADAEFTLEVVEPWLELKKATLPNGRKEEPYAVEIPAPKGTEGDEDVIVTYTLKEGSELPKGLTLESDGLLWGEPEDVDSKQFVVEVTAPGYKSDEAAFKLTIRGKRPPLSNIANPAITYAPKPLKEAFVGEFYSVSDAVTGATSSNLAIIRYAVDQGSALPAGFQLLPTGMLRSSGRVTAEAFSAAATPFRVVASAEGCDPKTAEFSIKVNPLKLIYSAKDLPDGMVGKPYADENGDPVTVAHATAPKGATPVITYTSSDMPPGLVLNPDGTVTGVPTKSLKNPIITVTAHAEGYSSVDAEMYIEKIHDAFKVVTDGIFEAELIDLTGKEGGGYSGAAQEEKMVQKDDRFFAVPRPAGAASGGYYVSYLFTEIFVEFKILSSEAVSGVTLSIRMASDIGDVTFTPAELAFSLNGGAPFPYGEMKVPSGVGDAKGAFTEFTVTTALSLVKGENVVRVEIKENTLLQGNRGGGPELDYIKLSGASLAGTELSWQPCSYNLNGF